MGVDAPLDSLPAAQLGVPRRPLPHLQLQQRARLHHHLAQHNTLPANAMSRRQHPLLETMGRRPATIEAATPIAAQGPPVPQTPLALHTVAAAPTTGWLLAALQQSHHLPLLLHHHQPSQLPQPHPIRVQDSSRPASATSRSQEIRLSAIRPVSVAATVACPTAALSQASTFSQPAYQTLPGVTVAATYLLAA